MKTVRTKSIYLTLAALLFMMPLMAQTGMEDGSKYGQGQDSINCLMNLSLYREFFKHNNYRDAIAPWRNVFSECPASSERMYVDGVKMYKSFISKEKEEAREEEMIDTLMLIYDRRQEYFNDEANVLGRKAIDLLRYRRDDIEAIEEAHGYLSRSVELDKNDTRDAVIITFVTSSITLNKAGVLDQNQTISDYFQSAEIVDYNLEKNSRSRRWERAKEIIDENMIESGILTCEALNGYFEPKFEERKNNEEFLNKVINFYYESGCDRADLYVRASEKLYQINPSPESAYNVARLFVAKEEYEKAVKYYKEAVGGSDIKPETQANYYYELGLVTNVMKNYCDAINYAREAVKLDEDLGDAYLLMGDSFIASRKNLGSEFEQRTAFWAAVDKYIQAKNADPSLADEANQRIADYVDMYPNKEEIFFRELEEGDSYLVKGCINEYTTVRARD